MSVIVPKLTRKFVGFSQGQFDLISAESIRRHLSFGVVVREILDTGTAKYRKTHKLPATYPNNKIDFNIKKK